MDYIKDNVLRKYLNGEIDTNIEKNSILNLDKELIKVCEGKTLLAKGEMTLIVGGKNSGKSKLMNFLLKQIILDELDLGFELKTKEDIKVIYFDSEMSENRLADWSIGAPYNQYGNEYIEETISKKLFIYTLKKINSQYRIICINDIYKQLQTKYPNTHFVICIDVGTCLTSDINNQNNQGVIDELVGQLEKCTLIITIHHSLKDVEKRGISMGSIGTSLERLCAIKLVIDSTDEQKRHKVEFHISKYQEVKEEKDYFYLHTEKDNNDKIHITGISDSNGKMPIKRGNSKIDDEAFKNATLEFINNAVVTEDSFQKNIAKRLMDKYDLQTTAVYDKLKKMREKGIIRLVDGQLIIQ